MSALVCTWLCSHQHHQLFRVAVTVFSFSSFKGLVYQTQCLTVATAWFKAPEKSFKYFLGMCMYIWNGILIRGAVWKGLEPSVECSVRTRLSLAEIKETPATKPACRSLSHLRGPPIIIKSCQWVFTGDNYPNPRVNYGRVDVALARNKQSFRNELLVYRQLRCLRSVLFISCTTSSVKTPLTCGVNSKLD